MSATNRLPWIYSAGVDVLLISGPGLIITALVLIFQDQILGLNEIPPWMWVVLIVGVDVSHVYSTLFRTYFDKEEFSKRQKLYVLSPLLGWGVGVFLYAIDPIYFWRVLAYFAVIHFVRQQYGFMMIYSRTERMRPAFWMLLNKAIIYCATIYPLVYWHSTQRSFSWFVAGDFFKIDSPFLVSMFGGFYLSCLVAYFAGEIYYSIKLRIFNAPKNLLLLSTALSWYVGIVYLDSDLAFTATNVITHGIPYLVLIWIYGLNKRASGKKNTYYFPVLQSLFAWRYLPVYFLILFGLSFFEEALWDLFVWKENGAVFGVAHLLPEMFSAATLSWLVPLLALPQLTHYILDAFIWRFKGSDPQWREVLFYQQRL